uniref:Uncharacterized protein n=1 Tax=Amphimedon queenslandica TaxID=400682 RepID=A0A1X7TA66_AMPQE
VDIETDDYSLPKKSKSKSTEVEDTDTIGTNESCCECCPYEIVLSAVRKILSDSSFEVTKSSKEIKEIARKFSLWAPNNSYFHLFSKVIVSSLNFCFEAKKSYTEEIDFMWRKYHSIRSSKEFQQAWTEVVTYAIDESSAKPSFFQHVTENIFSSLISLHYKKEVTTATQPSYIKLTNIEENIIRYVAGYICHKMKLKLENSKNLDLLLIVAEMIGYDDENDKSFSSSECWTNIVDRGGLVHVNDTTYLMFCAFEKELQQYLKIDRAVMGQNDANLLVDSLTSNVDAQFLWNSILEIHPHIDSSSSNQLLRDMVSLFVNVRGFAFAKSLLEAYKEVSAKPLQKSKGLRKALNVTL